MNDDYVEAESPASAEMPEQTPVEPEENSVEESREDTNTPTEESTTEETVEVEQTPKLQPTSDDDGGEEVEVEERVPNYQSSNEEIAKFEAELQAQIGQAQINPNAQNIPDINQLQMTKLNAQLLRLEEERVWDQALAKYPEIKTNKALDDLVYSQYQVRKQTNPNIKPSDVARDVMQTVKSIKRDAQKEGYQQAENDISQKLSGSRTPARRSESDGTPDVLKTSVDKYQRSGDDRDLLDVFTY